LTPDVAGELKDRWFIIDVFNLKHGVSCSSLHWRNKKHSAL